eukprot:6182720-Pleurochrysis_carterae.AAC.2
MSSTFFVDDILRVRYSSYLLTITSAACLIVAGICVHTYKRSCMSDFLHRFRTAINPAAYLRTAARRFHTSSPTHHVARAVGAKLPSELRTMPSMLPLLLVLLPHQACAFASTGLRDVTRVRTTAPAISPLPARLVLKQHAGAGRQLHFNFLVCASVHPWTELHAHLETRAALRIFSRCCADWRPS